MEPILSAQLTFALYGIVVAILVARQASLCQGGFGTWFLYVVNRLYFGFCFHWRANQKCPFPAKGPAIIIANHRSPLDPSFIWLNHHLRIADSADNIRVIGFMTAREYCEVPGLIGWICRQMHSIPTERDGKDMSATREAVRRLKNGELLGIFPEGRINEGKGLLEANPGVAWLALTTKVPVYPIFIHNAPQGRNMIEPFYSFRRVRVSYGDAIDLSHYYDKKKTGGLLREVTDLLMSHLARLGGLSDELISETEPDEPPGVIRLKRQSG